MVALEFFSWTTDQRFRLKWTRTDIKILQSLLREAVYMRDGATTFPPLGFTIEDVRELRTILDIFAIEQYGDSSDRSLSRIKEYFDSEIGLCASLVGFAA